ncbi:MAG TPA: PVC-type heme-binding CxxCH protein, partial [Vicinamibacterales bacterium]|nr:PVC-type heme-binding CxxCH protein [Vicinamibacterales bacterium]
QTQAPTPAPRSETRDRYLNPRETDLSLGLEVDPKEVPDIPPVEADKVLDTFRIKKGFRVELVAHEPMVVDPIQMAFDEDGRLYIVEMRWYQSETRTDLMFDERIGRIRLLEDLNGDGRFDNSTIFADKLRYPSAVIPYDGGVYVGLEPDLIYLKDRNGDGVADVRQVVFTGFGNQRERLDSQMFMNSLTWGLDNRIHGAKGHGGTIAAVTASDAMPLDLRNRDFSFDPRTHTMRPESGGGKQGLTFDDYGRKFVCTANSAVQFLMYEDRYAGRNPFYAPPRALVDVALEQGETVDRQIVHRISPEDPWRRVRNRWRAEGVFAGPPPQPPTYLIGSSGVTLYRGDAFPADYRHDVFIGIAGNNLVHHRRITPDGVGFRARRLPDESTEEFLASTDLWFRPVAFANGPDGALYIADLYREILDFSDGIPESIKRFKDLNRGNDRGRIYRVVPEGFKQPAVPKLGRASTAELVATLQHPNAWHRETAARLLYERQDKSAIPALAQLAAQSPSALGRLHALYALDGLDALAEPYVFRALDDPDPGVREHGVRLSERLIAARGPSDPLWRQLKLRADDSEPRVRYQLAFTLGEVKRDEATDVLINLIKKDVELPWMHAAALTSLAEGAGDVFTRLRDTPGFGRAVPDQAFLKELIRVLGHRSKGRELLAVLNFLDQIHEPSSAFAYVTAFADGLQRADMPLALFQARLQPILDRAMTEVRSGKAPEPVRLQAIELLGLTASTGETLNLLFSLVGTEQPRAVQSAAIAALGRLDDPAVAKAFLARWPKFTPLVKREVMPVLLGRPDRAMTLLEAVSAGTVLRNELTPTQVAGLRASRNPALRALAAAVFERPATDDRRAVIERYRAALDLRGNAVRGATTFKAKCATCHQPGSDGYAIGPGVEGLKVFGKEEALIHVLDPNRTVDARYRLYQIDTTDGSSLTGIIQNESENSVTIRQPFGASQTLPRSRIGRLQGFERSMMPDGLEEGLSLQDMADLLQFIAGGPGQDR